MTLETLSPLKSGTYYVNDENFKPEIFFNDANQTKYFIVVNYDYDINEWKVIYNGKLQGYDNLTNYSYRINIDKFIILKEYDNINLLIDFDDDKFEYFYIPKMLNKVSVIISDVNILNVRTSLLEFKNNGEVYLVSDPSSFVNDSVLNYQFLNKKTSELIMTPSNDFLMSGTFVPVVSYPSNNWNNIKMYNSDDEIIYERKQYNSNNTQLTMYYIPYNTTKIIFEKLDNVFNIVSSKSYRIVNLCAKPFYYWSTDGNLEVVYLEGNENLEETTEKEYIEINNKKYTKSIKTTKQLRRNTGYALKESQVYDLYKSSVVFSSYDGEIEQPGRNFLDNSAYPVFGHNISLSYLSNVIMTDEPETYRRFTPVSGQKIDIHDMCYYYYTNRDYYIISCWIRQNSGVPLNYTVHESPQVESSNVFTVQSGVWTRVYTKAFLSTYEEMTKLIITQNEATTGIPLDIKKCQIELENENYIIYEKNVGYMYKLEKDGLPTEWKLSLTDSGTNNLKFKKWILDNKTFDGWTGKLIPERNLELLLNDEKTYKKYLTIKTNFYD